MDRPTVTESGPTTDAEGFFDRFVHPRLARVATAGAIVWLGSFLVAGIGVAFGEVGPLRAADLFFLSGVLGLVGLLTVAACGFFLVGIALRRRART